MKTVNQFLLCMLVSFAVCFHLAVAQNNTQIIKPQPISNTMPDPTGGGVMSSGYLIDLPDLSFTTFSVGSVEPGYEEIDGYRNYKVYFSAKVMNEGSAASGKCNLYGAFSKYNEDAFYWGECMGFDALNAGQTRMVSGYLNIRVPAKDATAKVKIIIDAPCSEEFLPDYVKVQESNEKNNKSTVLTVKLY